MNKINEIIIIGGGSSISKGLSLGLKEKIKNKFVILINYSYKHFDSTFLCFNDRDFYYPSQLSIRDKTHPNIYEELKTLPLIVGINQNGVEEFKLPNTILLRKSDSYQRQNAMQNGFYTGNLTGIFALTLASYLMDYQGIIYLLGFDWTMRDKNTIDHTNYNPKSDLDIHYYGKKIKHRGIGRVGYYENHNPDKYFKHFLEPNLKIYNVSPNSNIQNFEKINYEQMFELLSSQTYNQKKLNNYISSKLRLNSYL